MKKVFVTILAVMFCNGLYADSFWGYVRDSQTGENLIGAYIYTSNNQHLTTTSSYGFFSLKAEITDTIIASYVGYEKFILPIKNIKCPYIILMSPSASIEEVIVTTDIYDKNDFSSDYIRLPIKQIQTMPAIAGESDLLKSLQAMPGFKFVNEGQSSLVVRGGAPDQNMIMIDDVPLYYLNHLGGFVSAFNTDALNDVQAYKGNFPAKYGGRLSSVIDVRTKDGNTNQMRGKATIGILSSKFMVEGPVKKDTCSYFLSCRRFMYDLLSRPITYLFNNKMQSGYSFYDLNAKINYMPNNKNRFYLSFYSGNDKLLSKFRERKDDNITMKNISKWGNTLGSLRWNHLYGSALFSNITVYAMRYNYSSTFEYSAKTDDGVSQKSNFSSLIRDFGMKSDFSYIPNNRINLLFGTNTVFHYFNPNNYSYYQSSVDTSAHIRTDNPQKQRDSEWALYLESKITPIKFLSLYGGVRTNIYKTNSKTYNDIEPRVTFEIALPYGMVFKSNYSKMSQFVHLLTYSGTYMPADLWMPSNDIIPPESSEMISSGLYKNIPSVGIDFSIELYYKKMASLVELKEASNLNKLSDEWYESVEKNGTGEAKGIEFLIRKSEGRLNGWISYTLSKAIRTFENFNNGKAYPYTNDATHDVSIVVNCKLSEHYTASVEWNFLTGRAITLSNKRYTAVNLQIDDNGMPNLNYQTVSTYEERNSVRMKPYHRLDASISYKKHKKRSGREITVGVYNLYNRQNPTYYYVSGDNKNRSVYQRCLFPFIPYASYTWIW